MIATMKPSRFNQNNVYLCKPIKNKIMTGGVFSRIIYSSGSNCMNGVYADVGLIGHFSEIYPSKFKFQFHVYQPSSLQQMPPPPGLGSGSGNGPGGRSITTGTRNDIKLIQNLCDIERNILAVFPARAGKTPQFNLRDQLSQNNFKFFLLSNPLSPNDRDKPRPAPTYVASIIGTTYQSMHFVLKISGVWATATTYGITYKFSRIPA